MKMLEGRNFRPVSLTDSSAIIINDAAAIFLGVKDPLNKKLYNPAYIKQGNLQEFHIIGVVKNFNFSSLCDVVTPLALHLGKNTGNISVRIKASDIASIMTQIKNKWKEMAPEQPFDYSFMNEQFNNIYAAEQKTGQIIIMFALLAILIACLGLFGLVTYASEQRTKEIGIRKVLGRMWAALYRMIAKDFLRLVMIAMVIAISCSLVCNE